MNRALIMALFAVTAFAATGCATFGPADYRYGEARTIQSVAYGTIQSVRPVRLHEDEAPVGTVAGGAIGGILGNSIGHGGGRAVATILGAIGGGLAGNAIEHNAAAQEGQEIVVRLDSGATIAVVEGGPQRFEVGQRVRVLSGPRGARVEHA
jgi:outer membrane lipoprotein SlyB